MCVYVMYVCKYMKCFVWLDGSGGGRLVATRTIFKLSPTSFDNNKNNNNYNKTNKCDNIAPQNIELFFRSSLFLIAAAVAADLVAVVAIIVASSYCL